MVIEKKMSNYNNIREIYSDDSYNVDCDEEYSDDSDKENSDGKIRMKKIKCMSLFLEKYDKFIFQKIRKIFQKFFQAWDFKV